MKIPPRKRKTAYKSLKAIAKRLRVPFRVKGKAI